jgi:oligosaccharyltransferase complex subunit epsilon
MAPKRSQVRESTPSATAKNQSATASGTSTPSRPAPAAEAAAVKSSVKFSANQSPQEVALGIWKNYLDTTPQRTKLIDVFMAFLVVVGVLQFVYCVLVGNYVRLLHSHYCLLNQH